MKKPYDLLWRCAHSANPVISQSQLMSFPEPLRSELLDKKFLVPTDNACSITVGENVFEVHLVVFASKEPQFYYTDEYGELNQVDEDLLRQYRIDFSPLVRLIHDGLSCRGQIDEVLQGRFWKIGAAGQQSREVHLARMWESDAEVQKAVADTKKSSLIFYIGRKPRSFQRDDNLIYAVDTLVSFCDNGVHFDGRCVFDNLRDMIASRPKVTRKKSQLKQDEHRIKAERLLQGWFRFRYENAKRVLHDERPINPAININFTNQKEFAAKLEIPQAAVTRMKQEWESDMLGSGFIYGKILSSLSKESTDYFIDLYNQYKEKFKEIGIEY
jgi:hypothetical protein